MPIFLVVAGSDKGKWTEKLAAWEEVHNFHRPHVAHEGQKPYEALERLLVQPE